MAQMYGKERTLETDKPDYDHLYSSALNLLSDMLNPTVPRTPSYADRFPTEYAYEERSRVDFLAEVLQYSSKIKNVESTGTLIKLFEGYMQYSDAKIKSMEGHLMDIEEQLKISNGHITKLTKQVRRLSKPDRVDPDNLRQQNEISRKELIFIFGIDPNETIDTKELDGLLSDYVDPEQDSRDLVRSIRGE